MKRKFSYVMHAFAILFLQTYVMGSDAEWEAEMEVQRVRTETERVHNLATALLDEGLLMGVFETKRSADLPENEWILNSGRSLRSYENWRDLIGNNWVRMWTVTPIKGEFDRIIFWKNTSGGLIESEPRDLRVIPFFGSQWLLILRPALDAAGRVIPPKYYSEKEKWRGEEGFLYTQEEVNRYPFLNEHNLFSLYDMLSGAICLKWPDDAPSGRYFVHPKELVDDLKLIQEILETEKASIDAIKNIIDKLHTATGRAVAEEISRRRPNNE